MPDPNLQQAIKEAYASAPDDVVILHTLEFLHPSFATPIRVVHDHVDHEFTLEASAPENAGEEVIFVGYSFEFALPEVMTTGVPEIQISIDNVSDEIEDNLIQASQSADAVEVIYRVYLSDDPTGPQNDPPLKLTLIHAMATDLQVVGRATFADVVNRRFPNQDYTAARFPGLIR